jgi:EF-P beta-lysylation protein EpmB
MKWRQIQRMNITSCSDLAHILQIDENQLLKSSKFAINIPLRLVRKMKKGDLKDPLFLQFAPLKLEEKKSKLFVLDPTGDKEAQKCRRLLHKYHGRALLLSTSACAMNCRYCFRRHFDYSLENEDLNDSIEYLKNNPSIKEIILSGGDPLSLSDKNLAALFAALEAIKHIEIIRLHSRFITGIPERVTPELLEIFNSSNKTIIFVQHINHCNELDHEVIKALSQIQALCIPILTQTVLLKGVNDCAKTLEALFWQCIKHGIIPYYLHQLDRTQGTAHFEVCKNQGLEIVKRLREQLPGYAVPKYVQEIAGQTSKTPI